MFVSLQRYEFHFVSACAIFPVHVTTGILDVQTRVLLLHEATTPKDSCTYDQPLASDPPSPASLGERPSLDLVSRTFGLNSKQHKAFAKVGPSLLKSLLVGHSPTDESLTFLGGLPGAGKSRVIGALQALARQWGHSEAVVTAAYQGVAAQAANGETIHKLFGWYVNSKKEWKPTQQQKARFAQVKLLILDEVSTCDVKFLGMIDDSLRKLLAKPSTVFGGLHVLLVGDWLQQLPTCGGQPAFILACDVLGSKGPKTTTSMDSHVYLNRIRGVEAYRSITSVVTLIDNIRHRNDPVWRTILDRWRTGIYEEADIELVNRIAFHDNWKCSRLELKGYCPIIVTSNALRAEFYSKTLRAFCKGSEVPLHRFQATITRGRHPLSASQQRSLQRLRDDKTGGMPIMLEIAIGSMVQCTKNASTEFKLANGSIGTVVGVVPAVHDVVQTRTEGDIQVYCHSLPPDVVYVRLKDFEMDSFVPGLPPGVVPVFKRAEKSVKIELTHRSFSVHIVQVPLVPAYSLTTEKCQGLTVDKMVLAPLKHPTRRAPQCSAFYVAVTRVKTLRQLYLMAPLTKQFLSYFTPNVEAISECRRLEELED